MENVNVLDLGVFPGSLVLTRISGAGSRQRVAPSSPVAPFVPIADPDACGACGSRRRRRPIVPAFLLSAGCDRGPNSPTARRLIAAIRGLDPMADHSRCAGSTLLAVRGDQARTAECSTRLMIATMRGQYRGSRPIVVTLPLHSGGATADAATQRRACATYPAPTAAAMKWWRCSGSDSPRGS
jgi:hypothetical protein